MKVAPEGDPSYFGFTDLNGFKDYLGCVMLCAPELFPQEDWHGPDEQMNLERAFVGLRYRLKLIAQEVNNSALLNECRRLVEEAYGLYLTGQDHAGQNKLEEVDKLLADIPTP